MVPGRQPIVAYNGQVYEDACVYAFIKNLTGAEGSGGAGRQTGCGCVQQ